MARLKTLNDLEVSQNYAENQKNLWIIRGKSKPSIHEIILECLNHPIKENDTTAYLSTASNKGVTLFKEDILKFKSGLIILMENVKISTQPKEVEIRPTSFKVNENEKAQTYAMIPVLSCDSIPPINRFNKEFTLGINWEIDPSYEILYKASEGNGNIYVELRPALDEKINEDHKVFTAIVPSSTISSKTKEMQFKIEISGAPKPYKRLDYID